MMLAYRKFLKNSAYRMIGVATRREAEDALEKVRPSVIILDIVLRAEDSWKLLAHLKEDPSTKEIPVLVVSTLEDQAKGFHLGVDDYMVKPFERQVLLEKLHRLTGTALAPRMLLIDDNELDRYVLQQNLKEFSMNVTECATGLEGISKACEEKPDLIFWTSKCRI